MTDDIKKPAATPFPKKVDPRRRRHSRHPPQLPRQGGARHGAALAGSTLAAPAVIAQAGTIKWRLQTYSGAPLGAHVIKPQIDAFNAAANGAMEIELYYADQLVGRPPTCSAPCSPARSTRCSRTRPPWPRRSISLSSAATSPSPPLQPRCAGAVPLLRPQGNLGRGLCRGAERHLALHRRLGPLHIFTVNKPIKSLADMAGLRVFGVPTAGKFLSKYGLVP